ncbi:MAG: hypothetical protein NUV48_15200 [Peptococcaceae bacterium]|jgi:hypothetical protein|nr:hypothetical protein [Peptococcaceae bacterium]
MRQVITNDFGQVKVGGVILPGNIQSMEIEGGVRTDEMEVPGTSGTSKQPQGFKDALINLTLQLPTDDTSTCYEKLKTIVGILQKLDKNAKPYIYQIVNKHTAIWNIKEVIFETLRSTEDNKNDTITAELAFKEWRPVVVKSEARILTEDILEPDDFGAETETIEDFVTRKLAQTPAIDDDE